MRFIPSRPDVIYAFLEFKQFKQRNSNKTEQRKPPPDKCPKTVTVSSPLAPAKKIFYEKVNKIQQSQTNKE
jgi:hypothetical protein